MESPRRGGVRRPGESQELLERMLWQAQDPVQEEEAAVVGVVDLATRGTEEEVEAPGREEAAVEILDDAPREEREEAAASDSEEELGSCNGKRV